MTKQAILLNIGEKKFFTFKKNFPQLVEFTKTFAAEAFLVEVENKEGLLDLEELAPAVCDANYTNPNLEYKSIEQIYPKVDQKTDEKRSRSVLLQAATHIRSFIRHKLLGKEELSLKELKLQFHHYGLTDACFCNHFTFVRKALESDGYIVSKIGGGRYKIVAK